MAETTEARRGMSRRDFMKTTTVAAGVAALAGTGKVSLSALEAKAAEEAESTEEKTYVNLCRANCGGQCPLVGTVREGKLVQAYPTVFTGDSRVIQTGCVKGQANPLRMYAPHRNLYPMRQMGERGSDNWERVSWDEALDLVVEKFTAAIRDYGPQSIAFEQGAGDGAGYLSGAYPIFHSYPRNPSAGLAQERFRQALGTTYLNFDSDMAVSYMSSDQLLTASNSAEDLPNAKLIIIWARNTATTSATGWVKILEAKRAGAQIINIDPQFTRNADIADMWIPVRVGSDGALVLAMCNYIIDNGLVDEDYLKNKSVAPLLCKADGKYVRLSDLGEVPEGTTDTPVVYDLNTNTYVSSFATGIDPALTGSFELNGESLRTVYDMAVENIKPFTTAYAAEQCGITEEQVVAVANAYATVKPASIVYGMGIEHCWNTWRLFLGLPFLASLTGNSQKPGASLQGGYMYSTNMTAGPVNTNVADMYLADAKPGLVMQSGNIVQIMETGKWAGKDLTIRCLVFKDANPLNSSAGYNARRDAFRKIDFVVCEDPLFTATAREADLILPVCLSWEYEEWNTNWMRQKAVEPAGECRTDFEILKEIADRMGYTDILPYTEEEYLRRLLDSPENIAAGRGYDAYHESGIFFGPFYPMEYVGVEYNATGRTQFYMEVLPPIDDQGQVIETRDRLPYYEPPAYARIDNPNRDKYPLWAFSWHKDTKTSTTWSHNAWLDTFRGYESKPFITLSENAAAERGIKTGDIVRVFNDEGEFLVHAVVSKGIRDDHVELPHGWNPDEYIKGFPPQLTPFSLDPVSGNNNFNDLMVQVELYQKGEE